MPVEASGSINYQGEAWYRKKFTLPDNYDDRRVFLHFEAIMGKSKIWINGRLVKSHWGGYLPITIDVTDDVVLGGKQNVIAVMANNENDGSYPPGKPQENLDFTYFGGIYRDVWLYTTPSVHVTDPNWSETVAGGGLFVRYENLSDESVDVVVTTEVINQSKASAATSVSIALQDANSKTLAESTAEVTIAAGQKQTVSQTLQIKNPHLWSPKDPYLHRLVAKVGGGDQAQDALAIKVGLRSVRLTPQEGLILNGKPYNEPLIGANRHQDFAYIGNAMPNSLTWRDARKLRSAGMTVIRAAHYPMDPAFMDACNKLGLFVVVATPGWQYWSNNPDFGNRVIDDIHQMVRRDRNHPSVLMWEPILNETRYPADFAEKMHLAVHEEFPFDGCYTACDERARGSKFFDVWYGGDPKDEKPFFFREWGDNVDDWNSQNSNSRIRRDQGEAAMLIQSRHYMNPLPEYRWICINEFYRKGPRMIGGCLWHSFDHQRGYHPDPFYGGVTDAFRQPKYSYYGFQSQRDPDAQIDGIENGPMIFIPNELSPVSDGKSVWVYSNCEEVRLTAFGKTVGTVKVSDLGADMPHPPVKFENVYNFMRLKGLHRSKKFEDAKLVAEGLIDGKVVVSTTKRTAKRAYKLDLVVDNEDTPLVADGSDISVVVASLVDKEGNVRRLGRGQVLFDVTGPARLISAPGIGANPRSIEWGTAPCLIQSTNEPGEITVRARLLSQGGQTPLPGEVKFSSIASPLPSIHTEVPAKQTAAVAANKASESETVRALEEKLQKAQFELNQLKIKAVERQQSEFETHKSKDN